VTIAVVMDSPTKGSHFGTAASAPVFADLAQQILEYLGVPHDQDLKPEKALAKNSKPVAEAAPEEHTEDLESLFAEVNDLPADDPLRNPADSSGHRAPGTGLSGDGSDAEVVQTATTAQAETTPARAAVAPSMKATVPALARNAAVTIAMQRITVPSFAGKPVREVVVEASGMGLGVQIVGSGIARDQAPAAGTLVPAGTEIVVRFGP
jgi:cell division protein FtsI (penicillin-binding protein 3)